MATGCCVGNNQSSSFSPTLLSSFSPLHLFLSFPSFKFSLRVSLSLSLTLYDPQLCPRFLKLLESLDAECVKSSSVSHSLGKWRGGALPQPHRGWYAALCLQHQQVWSGDPGEAEDPSSSTSQESVVGGSCRLRVSVSI